MRRRGFSVLAALTTVLVFIGGLSTSQIASASKVYSDSYPTVDKLVVGKENWFGANCPIQEVTFSFLSLMNNSAYWQNNTDYSTYLPSLNSAISSGSWAVSQGQDYYNSGSSYWAAVVWSETPGSVVIDPGYTFLVSSYMKTATITVNDSCELIINANSSSMPIAFSPGVGPSRPHNGWYASNFFVSGATVAFPNLVREEPVRAKYVAMGDSFSTGEGNDPFEPGTAIGGVNECHRSSQAYPRLLQADTNLNLGPTAFVACAGATMASVLYGGSGAGNWSEGPQVDALSAETAVVTITIGGNDVGFQEYLTICLAHIASCAPNSPTHDAVMDIINSTTFLTNLENVYEEILAKAPNAQVYVVDYPHLTEYDTEYCGLIDLSGGYSIQHALNTKIDTATVNVRFADPDYYDRLHYVKTSAVGSPFSNKHFCSGNEPDFGYTTFHPNTQGHIDYATVVAGAIG